LLSQLKRNGNQDQSPTRTIPRNPLDGNHADYKGMKEVSLGAYYQQLEFKRKPDDEGIKPANESNTPC